MRLVYVDTSAAMKMLIEEEHSVALETYLTAKPAPILVSSWLLFTELHCAVGRRPEHFDSEKLRFALDQIELVDISQHDFVAASRLAPLRSADALHLTIAMRVQANDMLTYDRELIEAARGAGLETVSPGV